MRHTRILLFTILCSTILLAFAALLSAAGPQLAPFKAVTTEELKKLLDSNKDVTGLVVETLVRVVVTNLLDGVSDNLLVVDCALERDFTKDLGMRRVS